MRSERSGVLARLGACLPEASLSALLQQERAQLRLLGAAAEAPPSPCTRASLPPQVARKLRANALRLAWQEPLLLSAAAPVARKAPAEPLRPSPDLLP